MLASSASSIVSPCPSRNDLWQAIQGECSTEDAMRIIAHAGSCPVCAEHWRKMCELSLEMSDAVKTPWPEVAPEAFDPHEESTFARNAFANYAPSPGQGGLFTRKGTRILLLLVAGLLLAMLLS